MTAPAWQDVAITPTCSTPPDKGTIKLPNDRVIPSDKVLVRKKGASGTAMLLNARLREDGGLGACLEASTVKKLGQENATVEYRAPSTWELYRYQPALIWKSIIALLSFVAALIAGWSAFIATKDPTTNEFDVMTATLVLAIACVTAVYELYKGLAGGE